MNGYSGVQFQRQNGRRNDRDINQFGRRGASWRQSRFPKSGASGANDTPLGILKRSSISQGVVEEGQDTATYDVNSRTAETTTGNGTGKEQIVENSVRFS